MSLDLDLKTGPHISIDKSLNGPRSLGADAIAIIFNLLEILFNVYVLCWEREEVKSVDRIVLNVL